MQYNSHADQQDLVSDIDFWASTDSITYPIEDKTRNANFGLSRATTKIMQADRTWKHVSSNNTTIPIATTTLTAALEDYTLASSHIKILRVRFKDRNGVLKTVPAIDRGNLSDDQLNAVGEPEGYTKIGSSLLPYPIPDYGFDEGVEIQYQPGAEYFDITDTTKEPGFNPDFHRLVSLYAARDYCALHNRERLAIIDPEIAKMESDIKQAYDARDIDDEPGFTVKKQNSGISTLT